MISLETDRLLIRNFAAGDWQELQEMIVAYQASDEAQYEPPWPTAEEDIKGIAAWFAGADDYLAVCLKATNKLIGLISLNLREGAEGRVYNLGYIFHPGCYGQGYATESCRAGMAQIFGPWAADQILTGTNPNNKRSVRLLERLGLRAIDNGEWIMTREEWLAGQGAAHSS